MSVTKLAVFKGIKKVALGNSNRGLKEVATDLLHEFGDSPKAKKQLAELTHLAPATIDRLMDQSSKDYDRYSPLSDTLERVFKARGCQVSFAEIEIKAEFLPQPKTEFSKSIAIYDEDEMNSAAVDKTA